jgi:polysaccharide export outer membrane protein
MFPSISRVGVCTFLIGWLASAVAGDLINDQDAGAKKIGADTATVPDANAPVRRVALPSTHDYVIGPHDLLEISVFRVDELSRTVRVNSRGAISMPMIGTIQAAGMTAAEVEDQIAARLLECCLQDPQVSIFIKEFVSQRVTVEGEVEKPGVYALTGRTTLLQALAMASGVGELAELGDVRVFRDQQDGTKEQLLYDIKAIREGVQPDPVIQGNDIVVVNRSGSKGFIRDVTNTLRGFIGFGTVR